MLKKLIMWLLFIVIVPLIPFACNYQLFLAQGIKTSFPLLFQNGELLLISMLIAATGIGAAISSTSKSKIRYFVNGTCSLILIYVAILYGSIHSAIRMDVQFDIYVLFELSFNWFIRSVFVSAACIALSDK